MLYLIFYSQGECRSEQQPANTHKHTHLLPLFTLVQVSIRHGFFPPPLTSSVVLSLQCKAAAGTGPISDPSLRPGQSMTEGQSQAASHSQYKCLELSNKDHQENRTGERPKSSKAQTNYLWESTTITLEGGRVGSKHCCCSC